MAYFGKLGGLLRRSAAQSVLTASGLGSATVAVPAMLVAQRMMSSSKLFIGGKFFVRVCRDRVFGRADESHRGEFRFGGRDSGV